MIPNYADSAAAAAAAARRASIAFASSTRTGGTCAACHRYLSPPRIGSYSPSVTRLPVFTSERVGSGPNLTGVLENMMRERRRRTFPVEDSVRAPSDVTRFGDCQPHFLDIPVARRRLLLLLGGSRDGETFGGPAGGVHARADAVVREEGEEAGERDRDCSWCRHRSWRLSVCTQRWRRMKMEKSRCREPLLRSDGSLSNPTTFGESVQAKPKRTLDCFNHVLVPARSLSPLVCFFISSACGAAPPPPRRYAKHAAQRFDSQEEQRCGAGGSRQILIATGANPPSSFVGSRTTHQTKVGVSGGLQ